MLFKFYQIVDRVHRILFIMIVVGAALLKQKHQHVVCSTTTASITSIFTDKISMSHFDRISKYLPKAKFPDANDIAVIGQRQVCHPIDNTVAVESNKCRHGFPRAFMQHPAGAGQKLNSGMIRLSCPHLVKEIDALEYEGGAIETINNYLTDTARYPHGENQLLRDNFLLTNQAWKNIRNDILDPPEKERVLSSLQEGHGDKFLNSGLIGITEKKVDDVKCLHAHVADELIRGNNSIGSLALNILAEKGVNVSGCDDCWQQCSLGFHPVNGSWWYTSQKNKQRLKVRRYRRTIHKEQIKAKILKDENNSFE